MTVRMTEDVHIDGVLTLNQASIVNANVVSNAAIARTKLAIDSLQLFGVNLTDLRVWDAFATVLPATPATDDLGLVGGTFGTDAPSVQTEDLKAAGATNKYARFTVQIPAEYAAGETIKIRASAGMLTTVADTTATIDFEVYKSDKAADVDSDLITTAATTINSLTLGDKDFTITPAGLSAGDFLDVRVTVAVNDGATGTAVVGIIGAIDLLVDIRG